MELAQEESHNQVDRSWKLNNCMLIIYDKI